MFGILLLGTALLSNLFQTPRRNILLSADEQNKSDHLTEHIVFAVKLKERGGKHMAIPDCPVF